METSYPFPPGGDDPIFRRVWERVTASEAPPAPKPSHDHRPMPPGDRDAIRRLCGFLEQELCAWRTLRALAKAGVREAAGLADGELRHARALSSRLFLLCGVRYFPKEQARPIRFSSVPEGLRACYRAALERSMRSDRASTEQRDPELRKLYRELSKDDGDLAQRLRRLTDRYLSVRPGRPRG